MIAGKGERLTRSFQLSRECGRAALSEKQSQ
jgi:hypothetical protein